MKPASGKDKEEVGLKRGRSDSTSCTTQRVPLGPGRAVVAPPLANPVNARVSVARARAVYTATRRALRVSTSISQPAVVPTPDEVDVVKDLPTSEMDVEDDPADGSEEDEIEVANEREVETMIGVEHSDEEEEQQEQPQHEDPPQESKLPRVWPEVRTERGQRYAKEIQAIRETFHDEVDMYDTTMVSEYAEEIFEYMCDLEVCFCSDQGKDYIDAHPPFIGRSYAPTRLYV